MIRRKPESNRGGGCGGGGGGCDGGGMNFHGRSFLARAETLPRGKE